MIPHYPGQAEDGLTIDWVSMKVSHAPDGIKVSI